MALLSIIIPTHEEEKRISKTLKQLLSWLGSQKLSYEIIVVDDSSDSTPKLIEAERRKNKRIRFFHFRGRRGKGFALTQGFKKAVGETAVMYDADGSTPAFEIKKLLSALRHSDVAVGSRKAFGANAEQPHLRRQLSSRAFNLLVNSLFSLGIKDTQCGFKAFKKVVYKKLAPKMQSTGFEWDVEALYRAKKLGFKLSEVGVYWRHQKGGSIRGFPLRTGLKMLSGLARIKKSH
ncbi:glycosyltransferase [Candidatus Micrarchaeota archaeon]|nr:glycosyltransferase [Candidatus Micrarchaeota archaeon]